MTTQAELERLTSDTTRLKRECQALEQKLQQNAPADDKLAIYKTQANSISKKKQEKEEEVKKFENDKMNLEK